MRLKLGMQQRFEVFLVLVQKPQNALLSIFEESLQLMPMTKGLMI